MNEIRKLIAAVVGIAVIMANKYGLIIDEATAQAAIDAIVGVSTAFFVWRLPNDKRPAGSIPRSPAVVGLLAVLLASFTLAGCSFIAERPATARLATTYATLKVIDGDTDKAVRVAEIAAEVSELAGNEPAVTIDALIDRARGLIRWDRLDEADTLLVNALLIELSIRLKERLGDGIIPEDARVTVQTVAGWVIEAAAGVSDD